jgi:hypothetical protein
VDSTTFSCGEGDTGAKFVGIGVTAVDSTAFSCGEGDTAGKFVGIAATGMELTACFCCLDAVALYVDAVAANPTIRNNPVSGKYQRLSDRRSDEKNPSKWLITVVTPFKTTSRHP